MLAWIFIEDEGSDLSFPHCWFALQLFESIEPNQLDDHCNDSFVGFSI